MTRSEFLQRRLDTITPAQMMGLVNVYNSLKDGIGRVEDFFEVKAEEKPATLAEKAKAAEVKRGTEKVADLLG